MTDNPAAINGSFVVEVGERQAWEFIGFCNNGTTPPTERRLYIDTDYELSGVKGTAGLRQPCGTARKTSPDNRPGRDRHSDDALRRRRRPIRRSSAPC